MTVPTLDDSPRRLFQQSAATVVGYPAPHADLLDPRQLVEGVVQETLSRNDLEGEHEEVRRCMRVTRIFQTRPAISASFRSSRSAATMPVRDGATSSPPHHSLPRCP